LVGYAKTDYFSVVLGMKNGNRMEMF